MQKVYKNKKIKADTFDSKSDVSRETTTKQIFFFPKANPPISVEAESREEAEKFINNINN